MVQLSVVSMVPDIHKKLMGAYFVSQASMVRFQARPTVLFVPLARSQQRDGVLAVEQASNTALKLRMQHVLHVRKGRLFHKMTCLQLCVQIVMRGCTAVAWGHLYAVNARQAPDLKLVGLRAAERGQNIQVSYFHVSCVLLVNTVQIKQLCPVCHVREVCRLTLEAKAPVSAQHAP